MHKPRVSGNRVCLVTTGHLSTNPRLVKEADALTEAGFAVRVVACKFVGWADVADESYAGRSWWPVTWVRFGSRAPRLQRQWMRVRKKAAAHLVVQWGFLPYLVERALHHAVPELTRAAAGLPADLYIAHNLAALPAAARAAARHGARLGFDAEDYHRGEGQSGDAHSLSAALTRWAEQQYIPACDYVSASSDGIAEAYVRALGIPRPVTILNVFPLAERDTPVPTAELEAEKEPGTRTLYWSSQTIGPGRGLEDVLEALYLLDADVHLVLRGIWAAGFEVRFLGQAEALGVRHRVRVLAPVSPDQLVPLASRHDIGLALESPFVENRDICITNKIFTYLLAGLPCVATDTVGQRSVCEAVPVATRLVPARQPEAIAKAVESLLNAGATARNAALHSTEQRFSWDIERSAFLATVATVLGRAVPMQDERRSK